MQLTGILIKNHILYLLHGLHGQPSSGSASEKRLWFCLVLSLPFHVTSTFVPHQENKNFATPFDGSRYDHIIHALQSHSYS